METVAGWSARTGRSYRPPRHVRRLGTALGPDDRCPVLFRYPGPCGLRELFSGGLGHLAPASSPWAWMSEEAVHADVPGARVFGTMTLREPLRTQPVRSERNAVWVGLNLATRDAGRLAWVSPTSVADPALAQRVTVGEPLASRDELARVQASVLAYLEEIDALERAGAPHPGRAWCTVAPGERAARLREARVGSPWTGRLDAPA